MPNIKIINCSPDQPLYSFPRLQRKFEFEVFGSYGDQNEFVLLDDSEARDGYFWLKLKDADNNEFFMPYCHVSGGKPSLTYEVIEEFVEYKQLPFNGDVTKNIIIDTYKDDDENIILNTDVGSSNIFFSIDKNNKLYLCKNLGANRIARKEIDFYEFFSKLRASEDF